MSEAETHPQSLYEFLEEFLDDAITRFPYMKGRLMIGDSNERKAHTRLEGEIRQQALNYLNDKEMDKGSASFYSRDKRFSFIVINELVPEEERDNLSEETKRHLHFVLDHELAHMCLKNGACDKTFFDVVISECVSDAYSLIRHFQRYDAEDYRHPYVDPFSRSRNLVMKDPWYGKSHFTAFVLEEIIKRKDIIDFDSLDHQQTVDVAWHFAMKNVPPLPVIEKLHEQYISIIGTWLKRPETGIQRLAEITLNPESSYYTARMGCLWLGRYLEDRALPDGTPINLPKEYLDDVAKKLKELEFRLARDEVLFNVPKKSQPRAQKARAPELAV